MGKLRGNGPMWRQRNARSLVASTCFHVVVLASLCGWRMHLAASAPEAVSVEVPAAEEVGDDKLLVESSAVLSTEVESGATSDSSSGGGSGSGQAGRGGERGSVTSAGMTGSSLGRSVQRIARLPGASLLDRSEE